MRRITHIGLLLGFALGFGGIGHAQIGGGPCATDFGDLVFAFAGDLLAQPQAFCPAENPFVEDVVEVVPPPPVSTPGPGGPWQSEPGDEGDYVFRRTYRCQGGAQQIAEYEVALVTRLSLVAMEVTQGVADADLAGVAGRNLIPGRTTVLRLYVEFEGSGGTTTHRYAPKLRGFLVDYPQGGEPVCISEFPNSPLAPDNAGGAHVARADPLQQRRRYKSTLNFRLPESWVQPGVFLRVEAEDGRPLFSRLNATGPAFAGGNLAVNQPAPPDPDGSDGTELDLTIAALAWTDASSQVHVADRAQLKDVARRLRGALPFPEIDARFRFLKADGFVLPPSPTDDHVFALIRAWLDRMSFHRLLDYFQRANAGDVEPRPWHGVLVDRPAGAFSYGLARTGAASVAFDLPAIETTHLHELGHVLGLTHPGHSQFGTGPQCPSPCPAGTKAGPCCSCAEAGDADWPNIGVLQNRSVATLYDLESGGGPRQIWGLDLYPGPAFAPQPLSPASYFEAMSYCDARYGARGQWLSDTNWQVVTSGLDLVLEDVPPVGPTSSRVRLYTGASDGATVDLSPVYEVDTFLQVAPSAEGEFTLVERDAGGALLNASLFDVDPVVVETPGGPQSFAFAIPMPYDPDVRSVEFLDGGIPLATIAASANAPTVAVLFPDGGEVLPQGDVTLSWNSSDADGDDVTHWVQLSVDDGATWETLAVAWPGTTLDIDTTTVPASDQALVRVIASDGFLNASDTSDATFEIVDGPPEIDLLSPPDGLVLASGQLLVLDARAEDVTDGRLGAGAISWTSSLDGTLGTGETVDVLASSLTTGTHTIVATATDSDANTATAQATVTVEAFAMPGPGAPARVDLEIELATPRPPRRVGETATFTTTVRNWGRDTATGVAVVVSFPPGLAATGAAPSAGGCSVTAASVDCSPGDLEPGAEVTIDIDADGVVEGAGPVTASVTTTDVDVDPSDNAVQTTVTVRPAADPDMDGDGFTPADGDCDDTDPAIYPTAGEGCNGLDDDCDGATDETGDSLCFIASACSAGTCDPVLGCQTAPLGNDVDGDGFFAPECGGTDCDDTDMDVWEIPVTVTGLEVADPTATVLTWDGQETSSGPGTAYDVLSGSYVLPSGWVWNAGCLATASTPTFIDGRPSPPPGGLDWYLVRAVNGCGAGDPGSAERTAELPVCP